MQLFLLDDLDDAENHHCVESYSVNHYFDQKKALPLSLQTLRKSFFVIIYTNLSDDSHTLFWT